MPSPSEDDLARRELTRTLDGLHTDPQRAMGLHAGATPDDVRRAFKEMAKRYHPARFARREQDVVRLANEVFLAMREAQEDLLAALGAGIGSGPRGPMAPMGRTPTASPAPPPASAPRPIGAAPGAVSRTPTPPGRAPIVPAAPAISRTPTPQGRP
ncbi:MAG TPA: hypothetical protein VHE35_11275, partial [Kofleriaceae bacterium]|nr:hypothetical protein [Kofleriaceae bacterium]